MLERIDTCPTLASLSLGNVPVVDFHMILCATETSIFILIVVLYVTMYKADPHLMQRPSSSFLTVHVQPTKFPEMHTKLVLVVLYTGKFTDKDVSFGSLYSAVRGTNKVPEWIKNTTLLQSNFKVRNSVAFVRGYVAM